MSADPDETGECLADRHADLDAGEFGGAMTDADYYDLITPAHGGAGPERGTVDCSECDDTGVVWTDGCNCGVGPHGYYGMHERHCGAEPCPSECPVNLPETTTPGGTA